ncbi:hypothetical protein [Desulfurivibrio dismutans]|uniref:hypothetical protein n=1 Tax=Desulfurivibrio dismutans TaxID=1398908 RepID=UPI0023DA5604|nr:hypothetical protein [Desulfurivibrio alkaliphilus]MDF1615287.1 hypothetical protein [Desulfurivibrio alkaliphilus]
MKKVICGFALVAAIAVVGVQNVEARMGAGPAMGGGVGIGLDEETLKARQQFYDETVELRRQIVSHQTALQAVLAGQNPDPEKAATLSQELFDLRTEKHLKAREQGIDLPGKGMGMQMGPGRSARGMTSGRPMMGAGTGAGERPCPMMNQGSGDSTAEDETSEDGGGHSHH